MATFLPEAVDGGWLFEIFRNVVNGADVAFVFFIFRWVRRFLVCCVDIAESLSLLLQVKLDPRRKVIAVAIGWTFGDNVFGRLAPFFGALGVEFDWTYFCQALDSNVSMIATLLFVYFVDSWAQLRRRRDGSENAQKYLFSALMLCVGLPLFLSYFAHVLGEWYALLLKAVVVSGVAYVVKEQGI